MWKPILRPGAGASLTSALQRVVRLSRCRIGRAEEAEPLQREALTARQRALGDEHYRTQTSMSGLGAILTKLGRHDEAETFLLEAHRGLVDSSGSDHVRTLTAAGYLVELYEAWGKPDQAAEWRAELPFE